MKKNILLSLSAGLAASMLFTACNKDDRYAPNNGNDNITLAYQVKAINSSSSAQKSTAGNIVWTSGFANPSVIKFEAKQQNSKLEYTAKHTGTIDLFAPDPLIFGNFTLGGGTYDELELKLQFKKHGADPAVQLGGQFTNNTMSVPVILIIDGPLEIKTEQKNVVISDRVGYIATTDLDLAAYTDNVTESMWANATLTNGVIVISENSNTTIYYKILSNFKGWKHRCHFWHR